MDGRQYELFVAGSFRQLGYRVEVTPATGDHGVDLILTNGDGSRTAVQCKFYSGTVGNAAVGQVVMGAAVHRCTRKMVVTNGTFTAGARIAAQANGVELIENHRPMPVAPARSPVSAGQSNGMSAREAAGAAFAFSLVGVIVLGAVAGPQIALGVAGSAALIAVVVGAIAALNRRMDRKYGEK